MTSQTPINDVELEDGVSLAQLLLDNAIYFVRSEAQDLADRGYAGQELLDAIRAFNQSQSPPLSSEHLQPILDEHNPELINKRRIEAAIATQDVHALDQCLRYIAVVKRRSFEEYTILYNLIRDAFKGKIDFRLFNSKLNAEVRKQETEEKGEKKDVATIAQEWAIAHRDLWAYDEHYQSWRMFGSVGCWEVQAEKGSFLDRYAVAAIQEAGIAVNTSSNLNLFQRTAQSHCTRQFIHPAHKINFANGTLNTETMQLERHDRDDNFTYCLPYSYNPYGTYKHIMAFLRGIIGEFREGRFETNEHGVQALMAHIGLALMEDTDLQKGIIALGIPGSGKSTVLDLVNTTCGLKPKQYVPHDVFSRELEGKRSRYAHNQKRVACIDEVPADAFEDEETVKQMIAHSGVPMRGLHKEEKEDNQWRPKLFLVANDDPHYKDISGAIKRRLIILRCPLQRYDEPHDGQPGQDPLLLKKLEPELGAFAAACICLALAVRKRGYYPQSASMKRDLDQLATAGNPLKACLAERFILDPTAHTFTSELYEAYKEFYVKEMGKTGKELGSPKFASALCGMGKGIIAKKKNGHRALLGIRLREETEAIPSEETYESSALLVDAGRLGEKMDGWDGWWTAENTSRPCHETASQATSQHTWTARTANSQISDKETLYTHTDTCVSDIDETKFSKQPSQPSSVTVDRPVEPSQTMDGTQFQPSIAVHQPSTSRPSQEKIPSWLDPRHPDWAKYVKINGLEEMQSRRRAWFEQHKQSAVQS